MADYKQLTREQCDRLDQILNVEQTDLVDFVSWVAGAITAHTSTADHARARRAANLIFAAAEILRDERTESLLPEDVLAFADRFASLELREQIASGKTWGN